MNFLQNKTGYLNFTNYFTCLAICIVAVLLTLFKFNIYFNNNYFDIFHIGIEIIFTIFTGSIFLITAFSLEYSKGLKNILLSSLFLLFVIINICHIYLTLYSNSSSMLFISGNITYTIFVFIFLLSALPPNRHLALNHYLFVVVFLSLSILLLIFSIYSKGSLFIFNAQTQYHILLIAALIYVLNMHMKIYTSTTTIQSKYTVNSILFLICTIFYIMLVKSPNDIYAGIGHILKSISIFYMFNVYFVVSIKKPYEQLQRAKKIVDEANNIKTDFIVNLSHELRTPVNIILNASKLINCDDKSRRYIHSIEKGTSRLNKVCESIIEFNKIENGKLSYSFENVDIVFLIDEILEDAEETADIKNLDVRFDFHGERVVLIDAQKLKIILLNLISNIIKYAPNKGIVNICLNVTDEIVLNIVNNGPTILNEEVTKIFNKFYKSKSKDLESTEGLGIGLYIANGYSNILGGNITIINSGGVTGYKLSLPFTHANESENISSDYDVSGFFSDIG